MSPAVKNVLVIIGGIAIGSIVNMGLIMLSPNIIPPPEGADLTTPEGIEAAYSLMEPKHFIMPFLAHALGTLAAGWFIGKYAAIANRKVALIAGAFFLLGGTTMAIMIDFPTWFKALDLGLAYIPMAWLGGKIGFASKKPA